jgi:hypothetical protein
VDALDGICITVRCYKHNRYLAHFSKPPSNFYAFAVSFETNIDEGDIGLIVHSKGTCFTRAWGEGGNVKAKLEHSCFKVEGDQKLVLDDQDAASVRGRKLSHILLLRQCPRDKRAGNHFVRNRFSQGDRGIEGVPKYRKNVSGVVAVRAEAGALRRPAWASGEVQDLPEACLAICKLKNEKSLQSWNCFGRTAL